MMSRESFALDLLERAEKSVAVPNGVHELSSEDLERELPVVVDGQASLGDLLSRVMQSIYAELSELAET